MAVRSSGQGLSLNEIPVLGQAQTGFAAAVLFHRE
jgi:hypothetical protein